MQLLENGGTRAAVHTSYSWLERNGVSLAAAVRSEWKLIENGAARQAQAGSTPPFELFSLGSDADERVNLARSRPLRRAWLLGQIGRGRIDFGSRLRPERTTLDPELRATLHALGYL